MYSRGSWPVIGLPEPVARDLEKLPQPFLTLCGSTLGGDLGRHVAGHAPVSREPAVLPEDWCAAGLDPQEPTVGLHRSVDEIAKRLVRPQCHEVFGPFLGLERRIADLLAPLADDGLGHDARELLEIGREIAPPQLAIHLPDPVRCALDDLGIAARVGARCTLPLLSGVLRRAAGRHIAGK
jgi:hypothetical protein